MSGAVQCLGLRRNDLQAVKVIAMLVDRGATENFVDNKLIPETEYLMLDYTVLDKPNKIVTAGQQLLLGIATGNLPGVITDKAGTKHDVGFPYLIVPGRGHSTSSSSSSDAATRGIKTVIETGTLVWKGATS